MSFGVTQLIGFGAVDQQSNAAFTDCVNITASGSALTGGGYANFTIVTKYSVPILSAAGTICRITMQGPTSGQTSVTACWIGQGASSGNAYNFDGGQVQAKFGGSNSVTLGTGAIAVSDDIAFSINLSRSILVAFNISGSPASQQTVRRTGLGGNYVAYEGAGVQEAGTTLKAGSYGISNGVAYAPFRIEVA